MWASEGMGKGREGKGREGKGRKVGGVVSPQVAGRGNVMRLYIAEPIARIWLRRRRNPHPTSIRLDPLAARQEIYTKSESPLVGPSSPFHIGKSAIYLNDPPTKPRWYF